MAIRPKLSTAADLQAELPWNHEVWHEQVWTEPSRSDMEYTHKDDPFRLLPCTTRGSCFEKLSRLYVEHQHGITIDADRQLSVGGHKLGKRQGSYDYGI
eukprot:4607683-Amphidinium_carterae.1